MLNCVDLDAISKVFRLLCICINSEYYDLEVGLAREALIILISNKPNNAEEIKKIIKDLFKSQAKGVSDNYDHSSDEDDDSDLDSDNLEATVFLEPFKSKKAKRTLRDESPFTKHFEDIIEEVKESQKNLNGKVFPLPVIITIHALFICINSLLLNPFVIIQPIELIIQPYIH